MAEDNNPVYSMENDPLFKPISDEKKKLIDEKVERHVRSLTLDENVNKDSDKISGQNYALISIVSPDGNQKHENICLKIKGVFNTLEEANKHAEILQKIDSTFDIYVVEMYSWLLVPPDPTLIEQKHVDEKLNQIIAGHRESQLKSKEYFNERKTELIDNAEAENQKRKEENKLEDITEVDSKNNQNEVKAESSINISVNGENCPNSAPISSESVVTPSELMDKMLDDKSNIAPQKKWGDEY